MVAFSQAKAIFGCCFAANIGQPIDDILLGPTMGKKFTFRTLRQQRAKDKLCGETLIFASVRLYCPKNKRTLTGECIIGWFLCFNGFWDR